LADFLAAEKAFATLYAEATQEIDQSVSQAKLPNTDWGALMASCVSPETLAVSSTSPASANPSPSGGYGAPAASPNAGNVPSNAYGTVPASAYGNVPASAYGNVPANAYGEQKQSSSSPAQSLSPQRKPPPPNVAPPAGSGGPVRAPPRGPPVPGAGGQDAH